MCMVTKQTNVLLHPAVEDIAETFLLANRLQGLQGKKIGLIDNRKRNADVYLEEIARIFEEEYGVRDFQTYRKASQSIPTPSDILDDMASNCDAIIHAIAD